MVDRFKVISDDEYTAAPEKRLDQVESGHEDWVPVVSGFYGPLQKMLTEAQEAMPADTDEVCPECHEGHLVRKASRFGPFMGCSRYPKCKFRRALTINGETAQPKLLEEPCPVCGRPLQLRTGRYGEFVGCSGYPDCKYIKKDAAQSASKPTGEKCPQCGEGDLVERTGRYGPFVACSRYPECKYRANVGKDGKAREGPKLLDDAWDFVRGVAASGRPVLFVGTKKQAQETIQTEAARCGMYFVNRRWMGGMLTNFSTVKKRIERLQELRKMQQEGQFESMAKKEAKRLTDELDRLM